MVLSFLCFLPFISCCQLLRVIYPSSTDVIFSLPCETFFCFTKVIYASRVILHYYILSHLLQGFLRQLYLTAAGHKNIENDYKRPSMTTNDYQ